MKIISSEGGEIIIRSADGLADRAAIVMGAAAWLTVGAKIIEKGDATRGALTANHAASSSWLFVMLWLFGFALISARIAWSFFGATKIFVSSTEVVTKKYLGIVPIYVSRPIKLSTITDVLIEEREVYFKGTRRHRWALVVDLVGGNKEARGQFHRRQRGE